ncbi:hypothetical protein EYF80_037370 [Liparis tanakae]|uniref:Uncharacterized protein n=1 Tax=Liparis tanakae TaxID=230148 RepID=A0A4Z2GGJ4_9TELE|nr:hypothetical protein EYF80_037370 [Liparis tanakae]
MRVSVSHLVKSMRMSAFSPRTSVKVSGVTSLQICSASRKTRRTFSSPICHGNRTILQASSVQDEASLAVSPPVMMRLLVGRVVRYATARAVPRVGGVGRPTRLFY